MKTKIEPTLAGPDAQEDGELADESLELVVGGASWEAAHARYLQAGRPGALQGAPSVRRPGRRD